MKKTGLNSCWSWIVAVACCIVYCLFVIVYRLSSLFYVELIEQFNIDRKTASIPFVVLACVRCISGFIFGMLGERYGQQRILFFSCFLCTIGVGASYFAQNVLTLSITLGFIYGFGMTGTALLPNIIREYFDDTATTISNGIINIGPCIAAISFPAIVIHLIDEYSVHGAFLISSGIIFNSIPFVMMLKPKLKPQKIHITDIEINNLDQHINREKNFINLYSQNTNLNNEEKISNLSILGENDDEKRHIEQSGDKAVVIKVTSTFINKRIPKCSLHNQDGCPCMNLSYEKIPQNLQVDFNQKPFEKQPSYNEKQPLKNPNLLIKEQPKKDIMNMDSENEFIDKQIDHQHDNTENNSNPARNKEKRKGFFYTLNVFKDPTFLALTLVQGLFAYTFNIWLTTMIDYSRDKGIDRSYEIYILSLNPITDIAGRLCLAWVTDKGFLSVPSFSAILHIFLTISSIVMALAKNFVIMTLGVLVTTFAMGAYLNVCPGMSYTFIEKDKQAVSIASIGLLFAPLSFTVSPLIGYFRGKLGSYDGLYYLLAVMNFACSLIVLLLPKLANRRERRKLKNVSHLERSL